LPAAYDIVSSSPGGRYILKNLSTLPNIGDVLAEKLASVEIRSYEDLLSLGSVETVLRIADTSDAGCYNMLYALEGAIREIRWHAIPKDERIKLKDEFDRARNELPDYLQR
jgi:DNA transformation protein and related proteins